MPGIMAPAVAASAWRVCRRNHERHQQKWWQKPVIISSVQPRGNRSSFASLALVGSRVPWFGIDPVRLVRNALERIESEGDELNGPLARA
jgi:hypothetical protein